MDGLVFLILMRELWEKINIVSIVAILGLLGGMVGTIVSAYITWRTDRPRLDRFETDIAKMKADFEGHKADNIEAFKEIRESIHSSNKDVIKRMDELMWYMMQSKITIKGKEDEKSK